MHVTDTTTSTAAPAAPAEPSNHAVRDAAKDILDRARDAIHGIEAGVDELNGLMVELIWAWDLQRGGGEVETLADHLGAAANELFNTLDGHLEKLRREITATTDNGDDDNDED
jgi:hypothetical protein